MKTTVHKMNDGYSVKFTIGTQSFNLAPVDKESAKFLQRQLRNCIKTNYIDEVNRLSDVIHNLSVSLNAADEMLSIGSIKKQNSN